MATESRTGPLSVSADHVPEEPGGTEGNGPTPVGEDPVALPRRCGGKAGDTFPAVQPPRRDAAPPRGVAEGRNVAVARQHPVTRSARCGLEVDGGNRRGQRPGVPAVHGGTEGVDVAAGAEHPVAGHRAGHRAGAVTRRDRRRVVVAGRRCRGGGRGRRRRHSRGGGAGRCRPGRGCWARRGDDGRRAGHRNSRTGRDSVDSPDPVAEGVGDVEVAPDDVHGSGSVEGGGRRRATIALGTGGAGTGDGGDDPVGPDPADPIVLAVGDVDDSGRVDIDATRLVEPGVDGRAAVPAEAGDGRTGEAGDDPVGVDLPDAVDLRLGDVEHAAGPHGDSAGLRQIGLASRAAVAVAASGPGPGDRRDRSGGVDLADPVVVRVGDVEIAGSVEEDPLRVGQLGADRRPVVASESTRAGPGDRADGPVAVDLPNGVVFRVGDDEPPGR